MEDVLDYRQIRKDFHKKQSESRQYWKKKEEPKKIVAKSESEQRRSDLFTYHVNHKQPVVG